MSPSACKNQATRHYLLNTHSTTQYETFSGIVSISGLCGPCQENTSMRLIIHYCAAIIGLIIYGVQVCPFLESLPSEIFAAIITGWLGAALALRFLIEPIFLDTAPLLSRPGRQFALDFGLLTGAGVAIAAFNGIVYGFPFLSGARVVLGCLLFGFFTGADTALARERKNIRLASETLHGSPPEKLFPVTRKFMLAAFSGMVLISSVLILVIVKDLDWLVTTGTTPEDLTMAAFAVAGEIVFIMAVLIAITLNLIISYSRNLKLLFANQTNVLERVAEGNLERKIPVATGDEFGLIAGRTNEMIDGLRHRIELVSALAVAEEIQGNLLPKAFPSLSGVDVAGRSLYSDETGGDYYDAFPFSAAEGGERDMLFAVGDVTGHGVGAALLMAAARAYLRMAAGEHGRLDKICGLLNDRLSNDVGDSGRFMTLFLLAVHNRDAQSDTPSLLRWIRAGHDPAMLYEPASGMFSELDGQGMALAVVEGFEFQEYSRPVPPPGSVLLIGTDGIWEAHGPDGTMFGKDRVRHILRSQADRSAEQILQAVLDALTEFVGPAKAEDDITLMVFKFREASARN